jgi:inorganic pyrophosphatase
MHYSDNFLWKKDLHVKIDRKLWSKHPKFDFFYPINYWFIPNTLAPDWGELDAYILWVDIPCEEFTWECIAIIHRLDDDDDKLIIVPIWKIYTDDEIRKITYFQEQYFSFEILR